MLKRNFRNLSLAFAGLVDNLITILTLGFCYPKLEFQLFCYLEVKKIQSEIK